MNRLRFPGTVHCSHDVISVETYPCAIYASAGKLQTLQVWAEVVGLVHTDLFSLSMHIQVVQECMQSTWWKTGWIWESMYMRGGISHVPRAWIVPQGTIWTPPKSFHSFPRLSNPAPKAVSVSIGGHASILLYMAWVIFPGDEKSNVGRSRSIPGRSQGNKIINRHKPIKGIGSISFGGGQNIALWNHHLPYTVYPLASASPTLSHWVLFPVLLLSSSYLQTRNSSLPFPLIFIVRPIIVDSILQSTH